MFSGSLYWLHTQNYKMTMKRSLDTQEQSQEILSWFSDDVGQWLFQRPSNNDKRTMSSRLCTHGFPCSANDCSTILEPTKIKGYSVYLWWTHRPLQRRKSETSFLKYLYLYWIKWNQIAWTFITWAEALLIQSIQLP